MTAPSTNFFYAGAGLWGNAMGDHLHDRCHLPAAGGPAGPERPALGHPDRQERRPAADRRRLLHGAPVPGDLCRHPLHGRAGARPGRADRHPEPRPGSRSSRSTGRGTWSPTSSSRPSRRGSSGGSRAPDSRRVLRLDPRAVVEPLEHDHLQITLIDPGRELDDLMPIALTNRPEIASRRALVAGGGGRRSAGRRHARSSPASRSTASRPPSRCSRPGSSAWAPTAA